MAILILAAGEARRMGKVKQLLPWGNTTLLGAVVQNALPIPNKGVYVVLGAKAKEIKKELQVPHVSFLEHHGWKEGMGTSIAFGVREIRLQYPDINAILLLLGDQPLISTDYLRKTVASMDKKGKGIVATLYGKNLGVPALFSQPYFQELMLLKGDHGARDLLTKYKNEVLSMEPGGIPVDVDTMADYKNLRPKGTP